MPQAHQKGIPIREISENILLTAAEKFDSWIGTVFHNFCGKFPQIGDWLTLYLYWCRNLISKTRKALPNSAKILAIVPNICAVIWHVLISIVLALVIIVSPWAGPLYLAAASNNAQPETVCRHQNVAPWVYPCWPKRTLHTWHLKHPTVTAPLHLCYSPDLRVDVRWRDIVSGKCIFALQAFRLSRERSLDLAFRVLQPSLGWTMISMSWILKVILVLAILSYVVEFLEWRAAPSRSGRPRPEPRPLVELRFSRMKVGLYWVNFGETEAHKVEAGKPRNTIFLSDLERSKRSKVFVLNSVCTNVTNLIKLSE